MDFITSIPAFIDWARKNVLASIFGLIMAFFLYAGYEFIGGYATKYGSSVAGEYDSFKRSATNFTVIDILLQKYLVQYHANRIGVARFHDNQHDVGDNRQFFVTYETMLTTPGVIGNIGELKDMSIVSYGAVLPTLLKGEAVLIWERDLLDGPLRELMKKRGTQAELFVPVNDLENHLVGMIAVGWLSENDVIKPTDLAEMERTLSDAAVKIGAYYSGRATNG